MAEREIQEIQKIMKVGEPKPQHGDDERSSLRDPYTAMVPGFNLLVRWLARRYFRHFELDA